MGGYQYFTILNYGGWLANNDGPTPIVLCTNEQVKGGWLATPSTPSGSAPAVLKFVLVMYMYMYRVLRT